MSNPEADQGLRALFLERPRDGNLALSGVCVLISIIQIEQLQACAAVAAGPIKRSANLRVAIGSGSRS